MANGPRIPGDMSPRQNRNGNQDDCKDCLLIFIQVKVISMSNFLMKIL